MKVRETRHDRIHVLHLEGEIDLHQAGSLRKVLQVTVDGHCPALFLDLSAVPYIDSTGIAVLIEYLRDATAFGGQFCITGVSDHVRGIFDIVQLHKAIPIFASVDEAKVALRNDSTLGAPAQPLFGERNAARS